MLSNSWYAFSSDLSVSVYVGPGMIVYVKALHLVRNSTCYVFIFLIFSCLVWFLVNASLVSAPKSRSNSPSLSFGVSTAEVNPN